MLRLEGLFIVLCSLSEIFLWVLWGRLTLLEIWGKVWLCLPWLGWIWVVVEVIGSLFITLFFVGTWISSLGRKPLFELLLDRCWEILAA
jgi:hypothetical protein